MGSSEAPERGKTEMEADGRACGGGQNSASSDVHDFHRQGTGFIKRGQHPLKGAVLFVTFFQTPFPLFFVAKLFHRSVNLALQFFQPFPIFGKILPNVEQFLFVFIATAPTRYTVKN